MSNAFDEATLAQLRALQKGCRPNAARDDEDAAIEREHGMAERAAPREATRAPEPKPTAPKPAGKVAPQRRFEDHAALDPESVVSLPDSHAAMRENRTLFPSTVVEVTDDAPDRLLISGKNNRKLGDVVAKGRFKGYVIYQLSLEERATCPLDCAVRGACYGNAMQLARRHRIGDPDTFYDRLGLEIAELCEEHPDGVLVRLHVLGDFPSTEYVANWADLLEEWPNLAAYGYTSRRTVAWGGDKIGDAIESVKQRFPDRFRIRWSNATEREDGATVIDYVPDTPKAGGAIVCPAMTDATACCATCALCWDSDRGTIAFIKHGMKSGAAKAEVEMARAVVTDAAIDDDVSASDASPVAPIAAPGPVAPVAPVTTTPAAGATLRRVQPITLAVKPNRNVGPPPEIIMVAPTDLLIEAGYQRDLSKKSMTLIRKIIAEWNWDRMKPPIIARRGDAFAVIDGQHTAIAAATLGIPLLPCVLSRADAIEQRAEAFVAHNRDRVAMTPLQMFHAAVVAGDADARAILAIANETGATIPRSPPGRGKGKPGQIVAIVDAQRAFGRGGSARVRRIFAVAVAAEMAPLMSKTTRGLEMLFDDPQFERTAKLKDSAIGNALRALEDENGGDIEKHIRTVAYATEQPMPRVLATLLAERCAAALTAAA